MAGIQDFWEFVDDFIGAGTFVTSAGLDPWVVTDTSSAGTPTYTRLDHGETSGDFAPGVAKLLLDSGQTEVQNVCLSFGDKLAFDINKLRGFECRVRQSQATADSNSSFAFGVTGDRNDAIDSIAVAAIFRYIGDNVIVVESDDTVVNNDDKATGISLTNAWKRFKIDFTKISDVKFFGDDANGVMKRLAPTVTFDMSNYAAGLQPFFQLQKASDSNGDGVEIDYVKLWGVR